MEDMMNNPDLLLELAQRHQRDLLREAAQARAALAVQQPHARRADRWLASMRSLLMGWNATRSANRALAGSEQFCCVCCAA
jgi:hypothetical protein